MTHLREPPFYHRFTGGRLKHFVDRKCPLDGTAAACSQPNGHIGIPNLRQRAISGLVSLHRLTKGGSVRKNKRSVAQRRLDCISFSIDQQRDFEINVVFCPLRIHTQSRRFRHKLVHGQRRLAINFPTRSIIGMYSLHINFCVYPLRIIGRGLLHPPEYQHKHPIRSRPDLLKPWFGRCITAET